MRLVILFTVNLSWWGETPVSYAQMNMHTNHHWEQFQPFGDSAESDGQWMVFHSREKRMEPLANSYQAQEGLRTDWNPLRTNRRNGQAARKKINTVNVMTGGASTKSDSTACRKNTISGLHTPSKQDLQCCNDPDLARTIEGGYHISISDNKYKLRTNQSVQLDSKKHRKQHSSKWQVSRGLQ